MPEWSKGILIKRSSMFVSSNLTSAKLTYLTIIKTIIFKYYI